MNMPSTPTNRARTAAWLVSLLGVALALSGCGSLPVQRFGDATPPLDPLAFFTGKTHSWGVFENRAGQPSRRFRTACVGTMEGDVLRLDQDFTYDDGHHQQRHWRIRRVDAHRFEATANDVVGTGTGEAYGDAFRWEYTVALKPGNPLFNVHLKQWMYLQPDGKTLLNRGTIRTLGVEIAQISEEFQHG